jgi:hypothetical protein
MMAGRLPVETPSGASWEAKKPIGNPGDACYDKHKTNTPKEEKNHVHQL